MNNTLRLARRLPRRPLRWTRHLSSTASTSLVPTGDNNHLPSTLIDFALSAKIEGEESQVAIVTLRPGERLRAESGAMLFMTQGVEMATELHGASAAFSRMMTGQNVFLTEFSTQQQEGTVALGTDFPAKIIRLSLEDYPDSTIICQRGAYLASNPNVQIEMEFTKSLSAGFFGGQGFILQRLSGQGDVLVKAGGTLVTKDLEEGEILRVTSGSIVGFTSTTAYDIQMIPGIKNAMFGGEGLFVTTLTGPGRVWLQGMPADRMIAEIARRVPSGGPGIGIPIGMGGGGSTSEAAGGAAGGAVGGAADEMAGGAAGGAMSDVASSGTMSDGMAVASEEAIQGDRNATIAASGFSDAEADSPSVLFGDAAAPETAATADIPVDKPFSETTFTDDATSMTEGTTFSDETSFSDDPFSTGDFDNSSHDSFWGEGTSDSISDVMDSGAAEEASSTANKVLNALWDFFSGD